MVELNTSHFKILRNNVRLRILLVLTIFVASISFLINVGSYYNAFYIFIIFYILLFLGLALTNSYSRYLFCLAFLINIIISSILVLYFQQVNKVPFIGGGDDQLFCDLAIQIFHHGTKSIAEYASYRFPGYINLLALWIKFLAVIGINKPTLYFNLYLLNDFVGAFIPVIFFDIIILFMGRKEAFRYALYLIFFPLVIFYSATMLRELYVTVPFLLIVFLTLTPKYNKYLKLLLVLLLVIFVYFIRPASAFFILLFPLIFRFISYRKGLARDKKAVLLGLVITIVGLFIIFKFKQQDLTNVRANYIELINQNSSNNSLVNAIVTSSNPLVKMLTPLYVVLMPIPSVIYGQFDFYTIFLSIGSFVWYWFLPFFILIGCTRNGDNSLFSVFIKSFFYLFIAVLLLVSLTSKDYRHFVFLFPLAFFLGIYYFKNGKPIVKNILSLYPFIFILILSGYLLFKGL